jgi:ABC-type polysaccharide/polyol phosphate export permease
MMSWIRIPAFAVAATLLTASPAFCAVVFSAVFGTLVPNYPLFVIIGLLAWNLFSLGSTQGLASVVDSGALIRKVAVPKEMFPIAAVAANLVNFLFSLLPLALVMLIMRVQITWAILWVPFGVLLIGLFTLGVALALTTLNVFFRDVRCFYEASLLAWFYGTRSSTRSTSCPHGHAPCSVNPMHVLVEVFARRSTPGHPRLRTSSPRRPRNRRDGGRRVVDLPALPNHFVDYI